MAAYREFVMQGNDEETVKFHKSGRAGAVFGSDSFKSWVYDELMPELSDEKKPRVIMPNLPIDTVISVVANFYQVSINSIIACVHGRVSENLPRKVAMYLCQELTGSNQRESAGIFNLGHYHSVSVITHEIRMRKQQTDDLSCQLEELTVWLLKRQ